MRSRSRKLPPNPTNNSIVLAVISSKVISSFALMPHVRVEQGHRLGSKLFHIGDGYFYHCNRRKGNVLFLRCTHYYRTGCSARASCTTNFKNFKRSSRSSYHCGHSADKLKPYQMKLRRRILSRCLERDPSRYVDIIEKESKGFPRKVRALNTAVRLRSAMRRARMRFLPNVPKDLSELHNILTSDQYNHLSRTISGKSHMYAGRCGSAKNQSRCLIFMSKRMRFALKTTRKVFCDSTWDGRPQVPPSSQLFSMTAKWDNQVIPLCIVLMESKKKRTYLGLFRALKILEPTFQPSRINCDFEQGQYDALRATWPQARIVGCLFHYCNNVSLHAKMLGFTADIRGSKIFCSLVRSTLALPLLPTNMLLSGLAAIMQRAEHVMFGERLAALFEYVYNEYLTKRGHVLSVCGSSDRTSNVNESFHYKLQNIMGNRRPNVFLFLRGLLMLEERSHQDIYCLLRGIATGRPKKISALHNDATIRRLTSMLQEGLIDVLTFLRRASYRLHAPFRRHFPEESSDEEEDN